jgi:hypothetical protein
MNIKNAAGATEAVEKPPAPGRAAAAASRPVALSTEDLAAISAITTKLSGDPATQTTLAAVLAKLTADPATQTTLAAVLAKLSSDPATAAGQTAIISAVNAIPGGGDASETTLTAILNKIASDPATDTSLDAILSQLQTSVAIAPASLADPFAMSQWISAGSTQAIGTAGAIGDYLATLWIYPRATNCGTVSIKDGTGTTREVFPGGGTIALTSLEARPLAYGKYSVLGGWSIITGANVEAEFIGNFTNA